MFNQEFFVRNALELAPSLLGCILVHQTPEGITSGMIVETEAYSQDDAASHTYKGETPRTKAMFGPAGHAYIYFTYGMHYCFNVVSGEVGQGQGVLVRALEPLEGLDLMRRRRNQQDMRQLCNGPAKLVQAMGITNLDYGKPLYGNSELFIKPPEGRNIKVESGPRIGITKEIDKPWRFWVSGNSHISH